MAKPEIHSHSSAHRYGGGATDYIDIHNFMDSSKSIIPSPIHRCLFHTSFGCFIVEKIFGIDLTKLNQLKEKHGWSEEEVKDIIGWKNDCINNGTARINSAGRKYSVRDVAERHILEDFKFKFIPTVQDFLAKTPIDPWMDNGRGLPPSMISEERMVNND